MIGLWVTLCLTVGLSHAQPKVQLADLKTPLGMEALRDAGTQFHPQDVSDVRRRAQLNDPDAYYFLGVMHFYGNAVGVEQSRTEAVRYFKLAADKGHQAAQVNLGMLLLLDQSNSHHAASAVTYFTRAAEAGDSDAQWCLGRVFYEGRVGRGPDYERASKWFGKSADAGNAFGSFHMGIMHEYGLGVPQSFEDASRYYTTASNLDNLDATYYLALLHAYGRGFPQDVHKASLLFKQAAERGHPPSQYYLGIIFLYGQGGFPRDYKMAFYWMDKAAKGPNVDTATAAQAALDELRRTLQQSTQRMDDMAQRFANGPRGGPEECEHVFMALDADADGRISIEEFAVKWHRPPAEVSFAEEDRDSDGFLSWDEFNGPNATTIVVSNASAVFAGIVNASHLTEHVARPARPT